MANAYGIVHQYSSPQSTFDVDLAASVLSAKQQQFDANQEKIDQTLMEMGIQASLIKNDAAKEYLNDRVNKVIEETRNLRTSDIGKKATTRKLLSTINSALDDKVLKHIGYGQKIQQFQAKVQASVEDGTYADMNYNDAVKTSGLNEYLKGDVDSDLGNLDYKSFLDKDMLLIKKVKEIKDSMGEEYEEVINADGVVEKVKINNLTRSQWAQVLPRYIDAQMKAQIAIEGRAKFDWSQENVEKYAIEAIDQQITPIKKRIEKSRKMLSTEGEYSEAQKKQLRDSIATDQTLINTLESQKLNQKYDMTALGSALVEAELINNTAYIVGNEPSIDRKYDKNIFERAKALDALNDNNTPKIEGVTVLDANSGDLKNKTEEELARRRISIEEHRTSVIKDAVKSVPEEYKEDFNKVVETIKESDPSISDIEAKRLAYMQKAMEYKGEDYLNKIHEIEKADLDFKMEVVAEEKAYSESLKNLAWKNKDVYKAFTEKSPVDQTKVVVDGKKIHSKDYLESKGVFNVEEYNEWIDTEDAKDFKAQVAANRLLSETNTNIIGQGTNLGGVLKGKSAVRFSLEDYHNFKVLLEATGEKLKLTDLFTFRGQDVTIQQVGNAVSGLSVLMDTKAGIRDEPMTEDEIISHFSDTTERMFISLKPEAENTKAYQAIKATLDSNNYQNSTILDLPGSAFFVETFGNIGDSSFYNDKTIRDAFSRKNIIDEVNRQRSNQTIKVNQTKKLSIQAATTNAKANDIVLSLEQLASSTTTLEGDESAQSGFTLDRDKPSEIIIDPRDPNRVIISQVKYFESADYDKNTVKSLRNQRQAVVSLEEFKTQLPELYNSMDLSKIAGQLNYTDDLNITKKDIAYPSGKNEELVKDYMDFFGDPGIVNGATRDLVTRDLKSILFQKDIDKDVSNSYLEGFKVAMNNSDKFSIKYKKKGDAQFIEIKQKDKPEEDPLFSVNVSNKGADELQKTLNVAPQVFLSSYFKAMSIDLINNIKERGYGISDEHTAFWEMITKLN